MGYTLCTRSFTRKTFSFAFVRTVQFNVGEVRKVQVNELVSEYVKKCNAHDKTVTLPGGSTHADYNATPRREF